MAHEKSISVSTGRVEFITTQWSRVLLAGGNPAQSAPALELFCRDYWPPLYAFVRRKGFSPHDAQDAVQEFITNLLQRNDLAGLAPARGRFRSFLLAALKNFLVSRIRAGQALKRGGGTESVPLEFTEAENICQPELTDPLTPEKAFDRRWARTIMERALERLKSEHRSPQQVRLFAALQPTLASGGRVENQAVLAAELGVTPGALGAAATRLRLRYRQLIEDQVRDTLENPADLEEEMRALRAAWQ